MQCSFRISVQYLIGAKSIKAVDGSSGGGGGTFSSGKSDARLDCLLMCLNGTVGQANTADFATINKTGNVVDSNAQSITSATINM